MTSNLARLILAPAGLPRSDCEKKYIAKDGIYTSFSHNPMLVFAIVSGFCSWPSWIRSPNMWPAKIFLSKSKLTEWGPS